MFTTKISFSLSSPQNISEGVHLPLSFQISTLEETLNHSRLLISVFCSSPSSLRYPSILLVDEFGLLHSCLEIYVGRQKFCNAIRLKGMAKRCSFDVLLDTESLHPPTPRQQHLLLQVDTFPHRGTQTYEMYAAAECLNN